MSTIGERIKQYADYKGLSIRSIESKIGASNGVLSKIIKSEGSLGSDFLRKLIDSYPEINSDWLISGKGEMLSEGPNARLSKAFDYLCQTNRLRGALDLAKQMNTPLTTVESYLSGAILPSNEFLIEFCVKYDLSPQWLIYDRGEMFAKENIVAEEPFLQYGYSKDQQMGMNTLQEIYFVPVPAQAGFLSHVADKVYKNNLVRIQLPPDYTGINYIFEVDGDSMYPTFTNGDHVGCRHLESKKYFRYGEPYLLDIGDGGILLKRVLKHENPSLVILRSDNILYQDIEVERQDILHAFLVTTLLSKNVGRSSLDLKN